MSLRLGRVPLLVGGLLSLVAGVSGGLLRAGVPIPVISVDHVALHAALLIGGFFGTVISLERAAAHGHRMSFAAPLCAVAASLTLVASGPPVLALLLLLTAGLALTATTWQLHRRQPQLHSLVLLAGAACFPAGTAAWLASGGPDPALGLWIDFLVLTIAGERLELSRLRRPSPGARRWFVVIATACVAGAIAWTMDVRVGATLVGLSYLALGVWLLRNDIALRTARVAGLTGFIGRTLLAGHVWLGISGLLMAAWGAAASAGLTSGPMPGLRDAALHAVLLGFVMSMVIAHAPIIFPVLLGVRMRYHAGAIVPVALLHASLVLRIAGDLGGEPGWRTAGAAGNAIALAAFLVSTAVSVALGRGRGAR